MMRLRLNLNRMNICSALLLGALCGGGFRVLAFPGAPALELRPAVQVDSSGIYLHQLVADPAALSAQPIRLADAPALGQSLAFSRTQLEELLARLMA